MEYGSRIRFVLLTIGAVILLVLSAWGIASIAKKVFSSDKKETSSETVKIDLDDYARPGTSMKISIDGPIVADEDYRSYDIEIGQDFRRITTYKGYGKAVIAQKSYDNNAEAYTSFLKALKKAGYTSQIKGASDDETGFCATGKRFVYEVKDQDEDALRLWGVSCTTKNGSFAGSGPSVRALFKAQIPDYATTLKGTGLSN